MKKSKISDSYKSLALRLEAVRAQHDNKLFWEFEYASRHAWQHHHEEIDQLLVHLERILDRFMPAIGMSRDSSDDVFNFVFALIHTWHTTFIDDSYRNIIFDRFMTIYKPVIDLLDADDSLVISRLHELTYKYGFLILALVSPTPARHAALDALVKYSFLEIVILPRPRFDFIKKGSSLAGIQFFVAPYQAVIDGNWDLAIFVHLNDKPYHIKNRLEDVWNVSGKQVIGEQRSSNFAFYIDRQSGVTRSHAMDIIRLQIQHYSQYTPSTILAIPPQNLEDDFCSEDDFKEEKIALSSITDCLRASEDLINKCWDVTTSNTRRSVGLLLWDQYSQANRTKILRTLILEMIKSVPKEILEVYYTNYDNYVDVVNKKKFCDLPSTFDTIEREMYRDYELADRCISDCEVYLPHQIKENKVK